MDVTRILHHSVNVEGKLDETTAFYRRLLSLPDLERPEIPGVGGHWFDTENAQVHLVDAPTGHRPIRPTGPHVCFGVRDLEAAVQELEGKDIAYLRALQGSVVQIWIVDPAGNTIELQQDPLVTSPAD